MVRAIHLTEQQRQAVEAEQGRPVEVVDPASKRVYFLVTAETFERVRTLLEEPGPPPPPAPPAGMTPLMFRSQQAFWRDLPELLELRSRKRQWVAYHGNERIGFGETGTDLYQECFRRGLERGEFYVGLLEPRETPPWGPSEIEESLFECSDEPLPDDPFPPA